MLNNRFIIQPNIDLASPYKATALKQGFLITINQILYLVLKVNPWYN